MSLPKRYLPLVALMGAAATVIPGLAHGEASAPSTASFTATDSTAGIYLEERHSWHVTGSTATEVTIAQGGTVTFAYPEGKSRHNVRFGATTPSSCTQTAGPSSGAVPPLPHEPTTQGWSGSCAFDTPGTYVFKCEEHPEMTGTIVVQGASQPPSTTGSGTGTSGTPPSGSSGAGTSAPANSLNGSAVRLPASQHGTSVHGSVQVAQGGSRLEVDALVGAVQLASTHRPSRVRVGRLVRRSATAGRVAFALTLDRRARRALRRHRRLSLTVRIVLTAPGGQPLTRTLAVMLHRS